VVTIWIAFCTDFLFIAVTPREKPNRLSFLAIALHSHVNGPDFKQTNQEQNLRVIVGSCNEN
jgi:hypothetical protein